MKLTATSRERKARRMDRAAVAMLLTAMAFLGAAVFYSSPAKADTSPAVQWAVCSTINDYPSKAGVLGVALALEEQGFTLRQAANTIAESVLNTCPWHTQLLLDIANTAGATA